MNGDELEGYLRQVEANPPKNASFRVKTSNPSDLLFHKAGKDGFLLLHSAREP